jgi:hypothetical protein
MPRIRRGGGRLRASGARTRNEDCCCEEEVTCANINNTTWRSLREASYDITGVTVSSGCSGDCTGVYAPSGVLPYDNFNATERDWRTRTQLSCSTCGGDCYYHYRVLLSCDTDVVTINMDLRMGNFTNTDEPWFLVWQDSMPIGDFALGVAYTLPLVSSFIDDVPCDPTTYLSSTVDVSFS